MTESVAVAVTKVSIRPNIASMIKTKGGSYHKDDFVGVTLAGLTVDQVKTISTECGVDVGKYSHLNPGQIRMTLGNTIRKMTNMIDENGLEGAALDKAVDSNKAAEDARDQIVELAEGMKESNVAAAAAAAEEKAAAKAAKAAAKPKKEKKAKVADDSEGEGDAE